MLHRLSSAFSVACIALAFAGCKLAPETTSPSEEAPLATAAAIAPGAYQLKAVHSGKCIELPGASTANGTKLLQATCNSTLQQQWKLRFVSGDIWEAVSAASGKCADVTGISTANGALIQQWDCAGSGNQRWHMIDMGSGQYEFKAVHSNRCMDIAAWSTADGAAVQQWDCHGGGNQKFVPVPVTVVPPVTSTACKRGYAYGGNSAADLQAMAKGVSWWYNWSPKPEAGAASVYASAGVEFVPMVWGGGNFITTASTSIPAGAKYLLAFNEPNFGSQSNLTAQQAASLWPQIEAIAAKYNLKIVSPATNFCGGNCNNTDPYNWLKDFFAACPNCKVDYIASHWYACDGPALTWHLNNLKQFGKPIWLTEFSCLDGADKSLSAQQTYMNAALNILENDPMVFRYAWFTGRFNDVPSINLLGASGQLTALGTQYVNYPQSCKAQ